MSRPGSLPSNMTPSCRTLNVERVADGGKFDVHNVAELALQGGISEKKDPWAEKQQPSPGTHTWA